jgi:hypothetical protein
MGKIVYNDCCFIWVKFHGKFFIKIGTLHLIIIIIMIIEGPINQKIIIEQLKSLICPRIP